MPPLAVEHVARAVDHTLLDPGAGAASLTALCQEADEHGFAAVCVYPWWVPRARALLQGDAAVCTVVSFPHGLDATAAKCEAPPSDTSSRSTDVMTTYRRPSVRTASASRSGSAASTSEGMPCGTAQYPHARVQTSPRIMNVAVPWCQHSPMFGQRASSHTVLRRDSFISDLRRR